MNGNTSATPKKRLSTKQKQRLFLASFAQTANVLRAAEEAGVYRTTVYKWQEHDADFDFAFNQAKEDARDVLRAEILRRGYTGWDEPVFQGGRLVGTVHKYSDTLLIFHAKALCPEYREKAPTIAAVLPKEYAFDANQDGVDP